MDRKSSRIFILPFFVGAAAAVSINPVLVQLAVVSSGRRRKKRDITNPELNSLAEEQKLTEIGVLERFLATETNFDEQAQNMVARYVECSGLQQNKVKNNTTIIGKRK